ncbi:hypothetical protein EHO60_12120 [Leptospira fletcheri]|uniref:Uncharacterized protein n=1 Tax=Leptospira fletcheri TaxID=2484981 RepID=A0A4R9GCA8_9LEPT|nr:hypothetical protein [Leptospira fletcheri]TGK08790.1 hypothetical protein EHO60_12120 [Leptospira fletcheri]
MKVFLNVSFLLLVGGVAYLAFLLKQSANLQDTVEFSKPGDHTMPGTEITYLILKRPKSILGGNRYYFAGKRLNDEIPFVQKYSPILDSEKDKFDKINDLSGCGNDTYIITLKIGETLSYKKFNIFDTSPQQTDEKGLQVCRRGKG